MGWRAVSSAGGGDRAAGTAAASIEPGKVAASSVNRARRRMVGSQAERRIGGLALGQDTLHRVSLRQCGRDCRNRWAVVERFSGSGLSLRSSAVMVGFGD